MFDMNNGNLYFNIIYFNINHKQIYEMLKDKKNIN